MAKLALEAHLKPNKYTLENCIYEKVNDSTVILRYKDTKNFRTLSYVICPFYIDKEYEC